MNCLVFHVVSGQSFFSGATLVAFSAFALTASNRLARRLGGVALPVGAIGIAVSSTAVPYWCYAVAVVITLAWLLSLRAAEWRHRLSWAVVGAWTVAMLLEVPYHIEPALDPASSRSVTVIGDSLTAGVADQSETWPRILGREHAIAVTDVSRVGATAATALQRIKGRRLETSVVLVEIGGNDLLGSTPSGQFERDLDALLAAVSGERRQVVMFELPLPPFCHQYGRIQRALAKKHSVVLIPKRVLLSVLGGEGATLDTIHLSEAGHRRMAARIWHLLEPAFPDPP